MTPLFQKRGSQEPWEDSSLNGDCFRTCIACLLDLKDAEDVPDFKGSSTVKNAREWVKEAHGRTLGMMVYEPCSLRDITEIMEDCLPDTYYILCGNSVQVQWDHCIICHGGTFVHDPDPDGQFINTHNQEIGAWAIFFLADLNPVQTEIRTKRLKTMEKVLGLYKRFDRSARKFGSTHEASKRLLNQIREALRRFRELI